MSKWASISSVKLNCSKAPKQLKDHMSLFEANLIEFDPNEDSLETESPRKVDLTVITYSIKDR